MGSFVGLPVELDEFPRLGSVKQFQRSAFRKRQAHRISLPTVSSSGWLGFSFNNRGSLSQHTFGTVPRLILRDCQKLPLRSN